LHILVLPSWYSTKSNDLSGSFFREQALALSGLGHKVGIIYPYVRGLDKLFDGSRGVSLENDFGVATYRYNAVSWIPYTPVAREFFLRKAGITLFKKYINKYGKPDIIHAHSLLHAGVVAEKIYNKFNIPYIVTEHRSVYKTLGVRPGLKKTLIKSAKHSFANFAVSEAYRDFLNSYFDNAVSWKYLPNMISPIFEIEQNLRSKNNQDFVFAHVSNLTQNKQTQNVIKAFAEEFDENENVKVFIGGEGAELKNLKRIAKSLNVQNRVTFLGKLKRSDVVALFSRVHASMVTSEFETFSMVTVEALASGIPVISSRCGGPESIIQTQDGIFYDTNDLEQLKYAMRFMYQNYNMFDAKKIRRSAVRRFGSKVITKKLTDIYQQVLTDNNR